MSATPEGSTAQKPEFRIIRGTHMVDGFRQGDGFIIVAATTAEDGGIYEWSTCHPGEAAYGFADYRNPPLVLDLDGQITRNGAAAGCGFLPDEGELERLAKAGLTFPDEVRS